MGRRHRRDELACRAVGLSEGWSRPALRWPQSLSPFRLNTRSDPAESSAGVPRTFADDAPALLWAFQKRLRLQRRKTQPGWSRRSDRAESESRYYRPPEAMQIPL